MKTKSAVIKNTLKKNKGMTLLEVLIALTLFTLIFSTLMRITDTTIKYRKKISQNIKETKFSRNVLQVIKKDIRNIFYTQDMNASAHILFKKQTIEHSDTDEDEEDTSSQNQQQVQMMEFENREIEPYLSPTALISGGITGQSNRLLMVSLSNTRTRENIKISDQNIVVYYLNPCKSREKNKEQSTCLWRKSSPFINQDLENIKNFTEFVLLEKVKKFQLSYYDISSNEWLQEWKTDPNEKNILPSSIRLEIEFENKKKQTIKREINVPLHQQFILPIKMG